METIKRFARLCCNHERSVRTLPAHVGLSVRVTEPERRAARARTPKAQPRKKRGTTYGARRRCFFLFPRLTSHLLRDESHVHAHTSLYLTFPTLPIPPHKLLHAHPAPPTTTPLPLNFFSKTQKNSKKTQKKNKQVYFLFELHDAFSSDRACTAHFTEHVPRFRGMTVIPWRRPHWCCIKGGGLDGKVIRAWC